MSTFLDWYKMVKQQTDNGHWKCMIDEIMVIKNVKYKGKWSLKMLT